MKKNKKILLILGLLVFISVATYVLATSRTNNNETKTVDEKNQVNLNSNEVTENDQNTDHASEEINREGENKDQANQLLPDLQIQKLTNAYTQIDQNGSKIMRFPGTFMNLGDGPLELVGEYDQETDTIKASQRIYKKDGGEEERLVGNFVFHDNHDHWHFEDFVEFQILEVKENDEIGEILLTTGKMTYCIHDYEATDKDLPGKPEGIVYPFCTNKSNNIQGISVGWNDTYAANVPGQELNINDLADGKYAFRGIVDPKDLIREKDENNNSAITIFEISGNNIVIISDL